MINSNRQYEENVLFIIGMVDSSSSNMLSLRKKQEDNR